MSVQRHIVEDAKGAAEACGKYILGVLDDALVAKNQATIALSGGSSPKLMFQWLAGAKFNWTGVHVFWVDERPVPPSDNQSNYKLALENLIGPAGIPPEQVHRIRAELDPATAAETYIDEIRAFFKLRPKGLPQFDLIHRGMGPDAHTASLFPGEPLIDDREKIAAAVHVAKLSQWRITLLPGVLLAASHTAMLVAGDDKAVPLKSVLEGPYDPKKYPAQLGLRDGKNVEWFLDTSAAKLVSG
jgi:6-phosphogluconolactonase